MSRGFMFLAALALATPSLPRSTSAQVTQQSEVAVKTITDALGLKPAAASAPSTLELGATITFSLTDPAKLAKHTIRGLHEGARVTVTRVAPDRVRVEADEMEPMPVTGKVTLKVNGDGTFTPVPDAQRGKPPAT
jgi:hypothetical protein